MAVIRTFIAVELSERMKDEIGHIGLQLQQELGDLKWVPRNNFHLTMKFLGDVESRLIPQMTAALTGAVQGMPEFTLGFGRLGGFPRIAEPRVIWIGIEEGKTELIRLQRAVDEALQALGFPLEQKGFSPHLTLARARENTNLRQVGERLQQVKVAGVGQDRIAAIRVMKSDLRPAGPVYTCLQEIRFK